jgi:hypothetical protein
MYSKNCKDHNKLLNTAHLAQHDMNVELSTIIKDLQKKETKKQSKTKIKYIIKDIERMAEKKR